MQTAFMQPNRMKNNLQALPFAVTVSILVHLLFAGLMVFGPSFGNGHPVTTRVINVSLVKAGPMAPDSGRGTPTAPEVQKTPPAKDAVSLTSPSKAVEKKTPPKATPKPKRSLKKATIKPAAVTKKEVKKVEQKVEEERPESVTAAIEALRKKNAGTPPPSLKREEGQGGNPVVEGPPRWGGGGTGGPLTLSQMDIYTAVISEKIAANWSFPQQLAGNVEGRWTGVAVEIRRDGSIVWVRFARRSGNRFLDESAQKAVRKSDPLPPLPESFSGRTYRVKFRFTPQGLK